MAPSNRQRKLLIEALIREASDVDLICYLARTEGPSVVQDLLECIADAHALSEEDLFYNLQVVLQKKREASARPMAKAPHRLTAIQPDPTPKPLTNGIAAVH